MRAIVTVVGKDKVGIIAAVCMQLASYNVNVLDISQTVMQGYFTMMMVVDVSDAKLPIVDDFVDGALGFPGAERLDEKIAAKVRAYGKGNVLFTRDTHFENYLTTESDRKSVV